jgi:hypothetical protein
MILYLIICPNKENSRVMHKKYIYPTFYRFHSKCFLLFDLENHIENSYIMYKIVFTYY